MVEWQPQTSDYLTLFSEQNPWHAAARVPAALAPPSQRPLATVLWRRLLSDAPRRHHVILGPRRTGKTTVLYQTVQHLMDAGVEPRRIWWFRLDHPLLIDARLGDLVKTLLHDGPGAIHERPLYLMLDEIAYAKDWGLWLKTFHDEHWPVRVAATSSSTVSLRGERRESGVGRWEEHHLLPCGLTEAMHLTGWPDTSAPGAPPETPGTQTAVGGERTVATGAPPETPGTQTAVGGTLAETLAGLGAGEYAAAGLSGLRQYLLLVGGFPELLLGLRTGRPDAAATRPDAAAADIATDLGGHGLGDRVLESQRVLRGGVVERAVYKDIPQAVGVGSPMMLERLLYTLAGQVTGILSLTSLSNQLGIAQPTIERYLSHLEQAYLVFTLTNYSGSESHVQRRGRKLYFIDTAVRNAALHRGLAPLEDPVKQGRLLENLAAASLNTLATHAGVRLHHWRPDRTTEADLIYGDPRQPLAFEVASSPGHSLGGLQKLIDRHPRFRGHCYLVAPQVAVKHPDPAGSGIGNLPFDTLLSTVGAQAHLAMLARLGIPT